jgi:GGDEF domain-containing protein
VASYPENGNTPEELLRLTDESMYVSKESGRNRITLSKAANSELKTS